MRSADPTDAVVVGEILTHLVVHLRMSLPPAFGAFTQVYAGPQDNARTLDNLMDRVDDTEIMALFDNWFDCERDPMCIRTAVVLDGALIIALFEALQASGAAIGEQPHTANSL